MEGPDASGRSDERPATPSEPSDASLWSIVAVLGVTQIVGYGTLFYSYPILVPAMARDLAVAPQVLFGVLSVGLLLGGLAGPRLGRAMDRHGAPHAMVIGSGLAAVLLAGAALAPGIVVFAPAIIAIEVISVIVQYDAAFASLVLFGGPRARRAITQLTLIAGFASTLFWPLTGWLLEAVGWRATYAIFALLNLAVALPLHILLARRVSGGGAHPGRVAEGVPAAVEAPALSGREARMAFLAVAASFALSGILIAAIGVHLVPILMTIGLGAEAFAAAALMGPAQVLIRLTDAVYWRGVHPLTVAAIAGAALPLSLLVLVSGLPVFAAGALFTILFGIGQGLESIVKGTVPLVLFGRPGYAERLGRLAAARIVFSASAPYGFAVVEGSIGFETTLAILVAVGVVAILPLVALRRYLRSRGGLTLLPG